MTTTVNVDKPAAPEWLLAQLPKELSWGQGSIRLKIEGAPSQVVSATARLNRVSGEAITPAGNEVVQKFPAAIIERREGRQTEAIIASIPKGPTGEMPVGIYRIDWTIHYKRFAEPAKGSKIYRGLVKEPGA